jgi:hypothetical protein
MRGPRPFLPNEGADRGVDFKKKSMFLLPAQQTVHWALREASEIS